MLQGIFGSIVRDILEIQRKKLDEEIKKEIIRGLQDVQNAGGCFCGEEDCPTNMVVKMMGKYQIPTEEIAELLIKLGEKVSTKGDNIPIIVVDLL